MEGPRSYLRRFSLRAGTDIAGTIERVTAGSSLTAENLWLMVCSAILASIGLDIGSAAVIIGAMLISPLMGPILGAGLGLGTTNRRLLEHSIRELAFATLFTLAASTLYFVVSPLATPTSEMIARTRPTLLDVAVAFFGGVAGIVAGSRKHQSLALPGVAIATALMPPLCTAGFGLATGNWAFFLGAFYLYSLNAVFIALSTFLVVRVLHFPRHTEQTEADQRRERQMVAIIALVAILPSMYFLYDSVRQVRERSRMAAFVKSHIEAKGRSAAQWERILDGDSTVLKVYVAGHPIEAPVADSLQAILPQVGLANVRLELIQSDISADDLQRFQGDVQRNILHTISTAMAARDSSNQRREQGEADRLAAAAREVTSAFPEIQSVSYSPRLNLAATDSISVAPAVFLGFKRAVGGAARREVMARATPLIRQRLMRPGLSVIAR